MLSLSIAKKLKQLLEGEKIPSSNLKYTLIKELLAENILIRTVHGRTKGVYQLNNPKALINFLSNRFDIHDLYAYTEALQKEEISKAQLVAASSDSKIRPVRSFKGFLANSFESIPATINNIPVTIAPAEGTFQFIYDFETLVIDKNITIVGVENAENFRHINKQKYLFQNYFPKIISDINPVKSLAKHNPDKDLKHYLFVSRYPQNQNKDLIRWMKSIENPYLHFGDFDIAGINIFLREYHRHLGKRATFFIPKNIENLISDFGSSERYNKQSTAIDSEKIDDKRLIDLIKTIHLYKKGLDQEIFIRNISQLIP